jgi:virulence factor Mce-like protein
MQKQAPSVARILTMVLFALSCFGLLLFLWLSFGGAIPLKPQGYRLKIAFPEATQLAQEGDVRIAGVTVGKVRAKELDPRGNRTIATIEMNRRYAPVRRSARAMLRQKTLLGETYVELTPGRPGDKPVPENGLLANAQVEPTVELDEIFNAFDPATRQAFRTWQRSLAGAYRGRGQDLSDSFGNLPSFAGDATDLLRVLNQESEPLSRVVRNTGSVFAALTQDENALRGLIVNSERVFSATASQNNALAETFRIFPTFLDESRLTLARLRRFAVATDPLIRELRPALRDLRPTLRDVRLLAPDLRRLFRDLRPLIAVSRRGLPALRDTLRAINPLLASTGPFLAQLNPILQWLELYQYQVSDFLGNAAAGLADTKETATPGATGHYLRQQGPSGAEQLGFYGERLPSNRGNTYLAPLALAQRDTNQRLIFPNWDCKNTSSGGEMNEQPAPPPPGSGSGSSSRPRQSVSPTLPSPNGVPACFVQAPFNFGGQTLRFAHVNPANYRAR